MGHSTFKSIILIYISKAELLKNERIKGMISHGVMTENGENVAKFWCDCVSDGMYDMGACVYGDQGEGDNDMFVCILCVQRERETTWMMVVMMWLMIIMTRENERERNRERKRERERERKLGVRGRGGGGGARS